MHGTRCLLARCIGCSGRGRKAWRDLLLARHMRRSMHAGRRSGGTCPQSFLRILPAARYSYLCSSSCLHQPVLTAVSWGAVAAGGVMCVCASLPSPAVRGLCACIFCTFSHACISHECISHISHACMQFACIHAFRMHACISHACMHFACMHAFRMHAFVACMHLFRMHAFSHFACMHLHIFLHISHACISHACIAHACILHVCIFCTHAFFSHASHAYPA